MSFTNDEVWDYLSKQGFGIRFYDVGSKKFFHLTLSEWHNPRFNSSLDRLQIITDRGTDTMTIEPFHINHPTPSVLDGNYYWQPNWRQIFSELRVIPEEEGSMRIISPERIYFGEKGDTRDFINDGYSKIRLLKRARTE